MRAFSKGGFCMLRQERLDSMVALIRSKGFMTVPQMCETFGVSPATIRRDLQHLVQTRLVLRNRNGAVPYQEHHTEASVHFRAAVHAREKERIAAVASRLIQSDSLIFIDSSSTALSLINFLEARSNLTIVTNSLLLLTLMRDSRHRLILTGGSYFAPSHAFYGPLAVRALQAYNFDLAMISSVAITPDGYAAETLEHSVAVRQAAMERSEATVLLCDSSKIGLRRPFNIAPVSRMKWVVTDAPERLAGICTNVLPLDTQEAPDEQKRPL